MSARLKEMRIHYGYEKFSSFEEFKTQLALGTISQGVLWEVADDEECPNVYKDHLIEMWDDPYILGLLGMYYKDLTDEQLREIIRKVLRCSPTKIRTALEHILSRKPGVDVSIRLLILEKINPFEATEDFWSNTYSLLLNNGHLDKNNYHPDVCKEIVLNHSHKRSSLGAVGEALHLLWTARMITIS